MARPKTDCADVTAVAEPCVWHWVKPLQQPPADRGQAGPKRSIGMTIQRHQVNGANNLFDVAVVSEG